MNINDDRKLIRARDIVLIAAVLAAAAAVYWVTADFSGKKRYAVISCGGETVAEVSSTVLETTHFPRPVTWFLRWAAAEFP